MRGGQEEEKEGGEKAEEARAVRKRRVSHRQANGLVTARIAQCQTPLRKHPDLGGRFVVKQKAVADGTLGFVHALHARIHPVRRGSSHHA